ncbi:hypothetical protein [Rhizobium sp. L51/94]|uniref:hypothetical protein n=1 Tax=Rhizobium sp. L51/94 TaxID=2819999 RepID=UPI001C5B8175|nr:hypothetical protein [Rhizobium sp. L51/94]QXZ80512.1 hypothetical protein J5274_22115 [Rhizobium sp. L51/94]
MTVFPLRFRHAAGEGLLFADDAGAYFRSDEAFLERYAYDQLSAHDARFLSENGHSFAVEDDLDFTAFAYRWARRLHAPTGRRNVNRAAICLCDFAA